MYNKFCLYANQVKILGEEEQSKDILVKSLSILRALRILQFNISKHLVFNITKVIF